MKDINLLPEEIKNMVEAESTNKTGPAAKKVVGVILVLAFVAITILAPRIYIQGVNIRLAIIQSQLKSKTYDEVRALNTQIASNNTAINAKKEIITLIDRQSYPLSETLNALRQVAPKGCYINSVSYDTKTLTITGFTNDSVQPAEFLSNVDRLGFLNATDSVQNVKVTKTGEAYVFKYTFAVGTGGKDGK